SIRCTGPGIDITVHPDEKGFYKIAPLPAGDYEIIATLPGYTVVSPIGGRYAFTVKSDLTDKNFVISSFSISGRVSLINSPGKVENVTVTLTGSSGTINTSPDEKGYYKFSILPAGSYSITASFENHTTVFPYAGSYNIKIPQSATGKDFKLVAYSISGTVRVNDISGPAGTIVYCEGPSGTLQYNVGNDGKFSFYPLPAGDYSLRAEKSGFKTVYPSEEVYQFKLGSFATKNFVLKRR
ncbi:MAG: carboxypeptidase-like regulatory domain-containing protein, partial [Candidatus Omnitrophica bacterium]|nr:carboxypeptidase-like regulatory domain-containing protein [Candidatus Omnitrophota bacterium]